MIETPVYDLTNFKVHFGRLTLKAYTKGEHVLRFEAIVHNTKELKCRRGIDMFGEIVTRAVLNLVDGVGAATPPGGAGSRFTVAGPAGADSGDQRGQALAQHLPVRDLRVPERRSLFGVVRQPGLLGQRHHRNQPRAGHQILVIEHGRATTPVMGQSHRKCPWVPW